MKLYKYKSLKDLWHVLDVIVNRRLYCAHWSELNDPFEGRYEIYLGTKGPQDEEIMVGRIEQAKNKFRVASLSADPTNFLLWSHYADGHKGVAIEIDFPRPHSDLFEVVYTPFLSVFNDKLQTKEDMRHLFNGKTEEWGYEMEYRVIVPRKYFKLPKPVTRVLLGPLVTSDQERTLASVLSPTIELYRTQLNRQQGLLQITSPITQPSTGPAQ